jgi:hypothetical protein
MITRKMLPMGSSRPFLFLFRHTYNYFVSYLTKAEITFTCFWLSSIPYTSTQAVTTYKPSSLLKLHTSQLGTVGHACNPSYLEAEIRKIVVPGQTREKLTRPYLNKPGTAALTCHPSYAVEA